MKRNADFLLREVAGKQVVVPVGKAVAGFPGMITLNESGAYLWKLLEAEQTPDTMAGALAGEYEIDWETAYADVLKFLDKLRPTGAIEE